MAKTYDNTEIISRNFINYFKVSELDFTLDSGGYADKLLESWGIEHHVDEIIEPLVMAEYSEFAHLHEDGISLSDEFSHTPNTSITELITLSEELTYKGDTVREYIETIIPTEPLYNKISQRAFTEPITANDKRIRETAVGILSDIAITEDYVDSNTFMQSAERITGYAPFVEFKVGDYEYKDATFRMVMKRQNINAQPLFYGYCVNVDIPDTFDRGESVVDGETKVYFNKFYYHAPEVNVTTISGSGITIPRIISLDNEDKDGRYFVVVLEDLNGEQQSGRISWSARGY